MSRTDLVADAFTMIRNALMAKKETVDIPSSHTVKSILGILKKEEYIEDFKLIDDKKQGLARVYLKYTAGRPAIRNIFRASRPGRRIYVRRKEVPIVLRGRGIAVVSTSKGILTDKEVRQLGIGGEIIGYIW
jgi:small subunit ribosomal protein S8